MHPWFRGDRMYTTNVMVRRVSGNLQHYERGYPGNVSPVPYPHILEYR